DIGGLALAFSLTSLIQMLILLWALRRKIGAVGGRRILSTVARSAAACAVMAPCTHYTAVLAARYVNLASGTGRLIQTFSAISVGIVVYLVLSLLLRMEEPIFVARVIKQRLRTKSRGRSGTDRQSG
ncbi:MAG TPA: polysaccharide biosynthesis C-terminal domain-containing protein, partial [Limnochordia bacterium]|nr:polysaccharide biosynthesis C-terminal domain-containing protein [Limnochordia bacterium]